MQQQTIRILYMPEVEFIMLACVMHVAIPQGLKCGPHHRLPFQLLLSALGSINILQSHDHTHFLAILYGFVFRCAFVLFHFRL